MRRFLTRVLRILAQFVVAGGFTHAIDAWVVSLDPAWQLTVLAITQLLIATAQAYLDEYKSTKSTIRSTSNRGRKMKANVSDFKTHFQNFVE